ncbi:barstar family protein [Pectobacterium wasabiae]|uniref:Barnase inhibitor n=1 Tax=Pectobacterium wasabiae TaxID=55208 RepID=A0AAW3ECP5_9GAMM|nr:barstar family protein [Pectobacterium wasabiae]AOR65482.1 barnase inhibitor [Pectobacterium wasabiae CFBP 3304]EJS93243.1 Ribonuclease inhibitor barstar [Pectobacterium wasabiae CFBP 3304]KFX02574.1 barnase inhibitor [Pectobacterium wasabiae]KGA26523.1 barnase inhibitor [Pectobacterium wasabiae]
MKEIILDGEILNSEPEFHKAMSDLLDFFPYYGRNLDALRDRLSNDVERPVKIVWVNSNYSKRCLGECFNKIVQIFEQTKQQDIQFHWDEKFDYILK